MVTEVLVKTGTPIVFADATDFPAAGAGTAGLTKTDNIDLTGLASGAARQSVKADLGALRAHKYNVLAAIEFAAASGVLSGESVDVYAAFSPIATVGAANPGGCSGVDSAYTGSAGDSLADSLLQLEYIGSITTTTDNTAVVQYQKIGELFALGQYVSIVVVNNATGALHSDAVEMYIELEPIIDEAQ